MAHLLVDPSKWKNGSKKNGGGVGRRSAAAAALAAAGGEGEEGGGGGGGGGENGSHTNNSWQETEQQQQQQQQQPSGGTGGTVVKRVATFLGALSRVQVPEWLLEGNGGVRVVLVSANGKTEIGELTVSSDKFTVKLTSLTSKSGGGGGALSIFSKPSKPEVIRSIDVGEMDRIQRGQATQQFETAVKKQQQQQRSSASAAAGFLLERMGGSDRKLNIEGLGINSNLLPSSPTTSGKSPMSENMLLSLDPERSFSIVFRGAKTLDLMATSFQARDDICNALDRILIAYQKAKQRVASDVRLLRYVWLDSIVGAGADGSSFYANSNQVAKVFTQINFFMKPKDLTANYERFCRIIGLSRKDRRRGLTFEQLADFLHYIRRNSWLVKPVTVLWNELFGEFMNNGKTRTTVSCHSFLEKFWKHKQGQLSATLDDVKILFRRLHDMEISHTLSSEPNLDLTKINKDQFEAYLLSVENDAFRPEKERLDVGSMHKPLSEYFINSSHNTYLIGDQYTSPSRVEMYSNALYRGCRCLELDVWDGGKSTSTNKDGHLIPVVWHGHTMTSKIYFVDIIRTIKVFLNFHPDSFPVILSFENHCSIPYQQVMAQQLEAILGDALYIPSEASLMSGVLPSPAEIRGMVVIKGRRPIDTRVNADADYISDSDDDSDDEGPTSSIGGSIAGDNAVIIRGTPPSKKEKHHRIAPQLARLTLFHGTSFKNWPDSVLAPCHHMHSFSENKVRSNCRHKQAADWIIYNQTHMSRTYPSGSRLDSSNYNPLLAWSTGCQMVALNFQTEDVFLRLNDGRFRENGNCGYVLKPSSLMTPKHELEFSSTVPIRLTIQILSGSCLPKPKGRRTGDCIDPVIRLSVFDVNLEGKEAISEYFTPVIRQNGFFPVWGLQHEQYFEFVVETWAAAMLQLTVLDKSKQGGDEFVGSSSIPIGCLRKGIRSVKLYDATNTRSGALDFASLLLDIDMAQVMDEI